MSLNRVFIMGNLGQDPELRYTPSQNAVVTMSVATTESRMVEGQRQDQTEWHRVVVWGKQAENCAKYLKKGRTVFVEGRIQTRSWDDKATGAKRYSTEVIAQNVRFVGGATSRGDDASHGAQQNSGFGGQDDAGYGAPVTPSFDPASSSFGSGASFSAEDVPF